MLLIISRCYTGCQSANCEILVNIWGAIGPGGSRGWYFGDSPRASVGAHVPPSVRTGCVPLGRPEPVTAVRGAGGSCYVAICGYATGGQGWYMVLGWVRLTSRWWSLWAAAGAPLAAGSLACGAAMPLARAYSKAPTLLHWAA